MQKYVVDLETAKKLAEYLPKGFESEFTWVVPTTKGLEGLISIVHKNNLVHRVYGPHLKSQYEEHYATPILEEMLELLPNTIITKHKISSEHRYYRRILHDSICYSNFRKTVLRGTNNIVAQEYIYENIINSATAAAQLYMWLVNEGHIKVNL